MDSIVMVLIGGLVSLASSAVVLILKQRWEREKLNTETKQHFTQFLYAKQSEYFDKVHPILTSLNSYLTGINILLDEVEDFAKVSKAASNIKPIMDFSELIDKYYAYLPKDCIVESTELIESFLLLKDSADSKIFQECGNKLWQYQNLMRKFVGIDELSVELMNTLGRER
jgi:hypothetical protein